MTGGSEHVDEDLPAVAEAALPGRPWGGAQVLRRACYDVLLLPGTAAVKVARGEATAAALERRTELLRRLARLDLPFAVPRPLSEVVTAGGRTAVALSWMYGDPTERRYPDWSGRLGAVAMDEPAALLDALRAVDCGPLLNVLGVPYEGLGGDGWAELMLGQVVPLLPRAGRREARRRIVRARDLPVPERSLVHGRLDSTNLLWNGAGRLVGVLGWDAAQHFDPALDAAWLLSRDWHAARAGLDPERLRRARIRALTLGFDPVARAILDEASEQHLAHQVSRTAEWLATTTGWWSRSALR